MRNQTKIIIADDNHSICKKLQDYIQSQEDLKVVGIAYDGFEAWKLIQTYDADLIILDLVMPNLDGLGVLERIKTLPSSAIRPKVIIMTSFGHEFLNYQARSLGVDDCIYKPIDIEILSKRIRLLAENMLPVAPSYKFSSRPTVNVLCTGNRQIGKMTIEITNIMHQLGVPAHIKGHQYIRDAVLMVIENPSLIRGLTKELYPDIAQKYGTEATKVERSIRHAIKLAWDRGQKDTLKAIFGYSMNIELQKPTNSEFITLLAERLKIANLAC